MTHNPVKGVKRPKSYKGKTPAIPDAQARTLLSLPEVETLKGKRESGDPLDALASCTAAGIPGAGAILRGLRPAILAQRSSCPGFCIRCPTLCLSSAGPKSHHKLSRRPPPIENHIRLQEQHL